MKNTIRHLISECLVYVIILKVLVLGKQTKQTLKFLFSLWLLVTDSSNNTKPTNWHLLVSDSDISKQIKHHWVK